jgi:hypothetical protein
MGSYEVTKHDYGARIARKNQVADPINVKVCTFVQKN